MAPWVFPDKAATMSSTPIIVNRLALFRQKILVRRLDLLAQTRKPSILPMAIATSSLPTTDRKSCR